MRFLSVLLAFTATNAMALTGNQALEQVLKYDEGRLYLQFYVKGVIDNETAVRINAAGAAKVGRFIRPFCMPAGATTEQANLIVENQLRRKPENNHLDFYLIVRRALLDAWPCTDEQVTKE